MLIVGCDDLFNSKTTTPDDITFTVTPSPNPPAAGRNTESLVITFTEPVSGLQASNIWLSASNVTPGALTGSGKTYTLGITVGSFAKTYSCDVKITKDGVTSSAVPVTGGVVNGDGAADYDIASVYTAATKTAELTLTFTKEVNIAVGEIAITPSPPLYRGTTVTSIGNNKWKFNVTNADPKATVGITITNPAVNPTAKSHVLPDGGTTPPGNTGNILKIVIEDNNPKYSKLIKTTNDD